MIKTTLGLLFTVVGWITLVFFTIAVMSQFHDMLLQHGNGVTWTASIMFMLIPCFVIALGHKLRGKS